MIVIDDQTLIATVVVAGSISSLVWSVRRSAGRPSTARSMELDYVRISCRRKLRAARDEGRRNVAAVVRPSATAVR